MSAVRFDAVLVANRGEIALRIFRTLRRLGIRAIAVHSEADPFARHVREADLAVALGVSSGGLAGGGVAGGGVAGGGVDAYLSVDAVVDAALRSGADAVHPGYGFLSENAALALAVARAGLIWIGPPPAAIEAMGDKIRAKATVAASGVPVVPGGGERGMSDDDLIAIAVDVGFPVLLKPSAGGGGKGMHLVEAGSSTEQLGSAIATARREAVASFGDPTLLVERWIQRPRHLEIQILADGHGSVIHLGERECSLQRRHQKVVEEAPSPLFAGPHAEMRSRLGAAAVDAARAAGYVGAGTVEFVVPGDQPTDFYFLEMNTRLQVEHPVTEAVTGLDLVEWQLRVAAGEPLTLAQDDVTWSGHAVEARVYAEDPARGFLPTGGTLLAWHPPDGPGIRVDDGIGTGDVVSSDFDPMLAKIIAWAPDRSTALARLDRALARTTLLGVTNNVAMLRRLVSHPDVRAGDLDTGLIEREVAALTGVAPAALGGSPAGRPPPDHVAVAAALLGRYRQWRHAVANDPWSLPTGWRPSGPGWVTWRLRPGSGAAFDVQIRARPHVAGGAGRVDVVVGTGDAQPARSELAGADLLVEFDGLQRRYAWAEDGGRCWLGWQGETWSFEEAPPALARSDTAVAAGAGPIRSPMPGRVRAVAVAVGDEVVAGQTVVTVEAMKMEYAVAAAAPGQVVQVFAREGQQVALDAVLIELGPVAGGSGAGAVSLSPGGV